MDINKLINFLDDKNEDYSNDQMMSSVSIQYSRFPLKNNTSYLIQRQLFGNNINTENIYRQGIIHIYRRDDVIYNISLLCSVMYCLKKNFPVLPINQKITYVVNLKDKMVGELTSKRYFTIFRYRSMGYKISEVQNIIRLGLDNKIFIQYITDYFNINVWIFNHNTNKIDLYLTEDKLNLYKMNLFLAYKSFNGKHFYEPIIGCNKKTKKTYFLYNHNNINLNQMIKFPDKINTISLFKKITKNFEIEKNIEQMIENSISLNDSIHKV